MSDITETIDERVRQYECVCDTDALCYHDNEDWCWPADNETPIPSMGSHIVQPIITLKSVSARGGGMDYTADMPADAALFHRRHYGVTEYIVDGSYPF